MGKYEPDVNGNINSAATEQVVSKLVSGLNEPQKRAVESRSKALLVVAGAGSGKTRVLTHRIAHMIATRDAYPGQILAITFTNKAANEMKSRINNLLGESARGIWVHTFHSACARILRELENAERLGYNRNFTIYSTSDAAALVKKIISDLRFRNYDFTAKQVSGRISKLKNELITWQKYADSLGSKSEDDNLFIEIFKLYTEQLQQANALDFDDLIGQTMHLFEHFPDVLARYQKRFRRILVDEYQDTNVAQYLLIKKLTKPLLLSNVGGAWGDELYTTNPAALTVVGDSDQSIYAFRGADIRNILRFEEDFEDAEVVKLEQNYRSTQNILSAANAVLNVNIKAPTKKLWTEAGDGSKIIGYTGSSPRGEAAFVADEIVGLHERGTAYKDIAVLYRVNSLTQSLEEQLVRSGVPYQIIGGTRFYDRAEVKDMLAYLMNIINPYDPISFLRLLAAPRRGIGKVTAGKIVQFKEQQQLDFHTAMQRADEAGVAAGAGKKLCRLGDFLSELRAATLAENESGRMQAGEILQRIISETKYTEILRGDNASPEHESRAENVAELLALTKQFDAANPDAGLQDFLTEVSLYATAADVESDSGAVSLMTLHSAKGLEFKIVFLVGVEEGIIPHRMAGDSKEAIDEERRLMYVGVTRAEEQLYLTRAENRSQYGWSGELSGLSRFILGVPAEIIDWRGEDRLEFFTGGKMNRMREVARVYGATKQVGAAWKMRKAHDNLDTKKDGKTRAKIEFPNMIGAEGVRGNAAQEFAVGDWIEHPKYGKGRIDKFTGSGSKTVADIHFDSVGLKRILPALIRLKKL
ncbi:UvrD-helicase domain-containing protein [Canibacter sp. lx-45]|uniref:ATP-dependent helicase n=1 Tax=Canibacter zhuwentaonis TaxID=2837491 RepID=UPI001BDDBFBA|nr:UvrD-helicase domain-containing protein [Canibacter zhuwentaonis]MBT1035636.1 UvrD-helicase domain-containing protein [Canibacter zhuwentaonis]